MTLHGTFIPGLPLAAHLTDILTAPGIADLSAADRQAVIDRLGRGLSGLPCLTPPGEALRITAYLLRSTLGTPVAPSPAGSFTWSVRRARRILGLRAVAACVDGRHRFVTSAVRAVVADLAQGAGVGATGVAGAGGSSPGHAGLRASGSLGAWLASLPAGGRAAAESAAVSWAAGLFDALDWDRLPSAPEIGGPDRWGRCPTPVDASRGGGAPGVMVGSRADVRVSLPGARPEGPTGEELAPEGVPRPARGAGGRQGLLSIFPGMPGATSLTELAVAALGALLASPREAAPARVMGLWPDCGRAASCEVDLATLAGAADAVVACVRAARSRDGGGPASAGVARPVRAAQGAGDHLAVSRPAAA